MPMPEPKLALIVVTHNSVRWLPAFFDSWRKAAPTLGPETEIILADSGSTDDTPTIAQHSVPTARIIESGNIGYGGAANRAAAASTAPWILLCNPDLAFSSNFESTFLIPTLSSPPSNTGCIAPGLLNEDSSPQPSVGNFPTIRGIIADQFRPRPQRKYISHPVKGPVDWATGACLLIQRTHWNAIHGFDEKFFLYAEEVDLQRRLAARGLRTYFVSEAIIIHHAPNAARPSNPITQKYASRGLLRYFAKHGTPTQLLAYRLLALLSLRLPPHEALAPRKKILEIATGPD